MIWTNHAVENFWLQVTVAANANTGLAGPDLFYFGSAVGDSGLGDSLSFALVNSIDENAARSNPAFLFNNIPITNVYDYNRDGIVNSVDQAIDRAYATNLTNATKFISLASGAGTLTAPLPGSTTVQQGGVDNGAFGDTSPRKHDPHHAYWHTQSSDGFNRVASWRASLAADQALGKISDDDILEALLDAIES